MAEELPQVGVLDFQANGASPQLAAAVGGVVSNELQGLQVFRVTSSDNVRHLLAIDRQRQLLGCSSESCVSSVTGCSASSTCSPAR